jgi:predicted extracellular nuclease
MSSFGKGRMFAPVAIGLPVIALIASGMAFAPPAQAVDTSSNVVISEVYGGGGNSGAPYNADFIELFNNGSAAASVAGWSVQYAAATGTSWQSTPLTGSIPAGGFYLVAESSGATGAALPTPDATGTLAMSATNGKIALVSATAALSCGATCSSAAGVVDFVGFGSANDAAGTATPALSNTTSAQRKTTPFTNAGNNSTDFAVAAPTPKAAAGAGDSGPDCTATPLPDACVPGTTTIQDVQGDGFKSPLIGQTVTKVQGVVTAVRTTSSRGFWMQETSPNLADTSASSGVFVFTSTAPVSVGDAVLVTGKVSDFYPLSSGETLATTASLSTTEIAPTTVTTTSRGNALPQPVVLTSTTVPDRYAPTVAGGNIESLATVDPTNSTLEFWEAHEGMRVEVDSARVVGPGKAAFGEIYVTTKPAQQATPRGGTYIGGYDAVPSGRLLIAPVNGSVPPANVGDVLLGATVGPVDWSTFGGYDIAATQVGSYQDNHLTATSATAQATDQLAIATYNVENLAPSDPASKYAALANGVVQNLASPDIISVEEIQDNTGATDDGVVAADQTLTKFTAAITAAGGPTYQWAEIDPVNDQDGGQPGGNIRVVFLYNTARVTFDATPGGSTSTATTVTKAADGTAQLSASPGLVDPTNDAWTSSRKPLAAEFTFAGRKVIVIGNHFASKGGDQNADGRFQPAERSSEIQRGNQATVLNGFVHQILSVDPNANVVLAGDFNDYQFSPSIQTLTDNGATLTDLINTLPVNERYTYVFNGVSQVLDHIFVSKSLANAGPTAVSYDVIHVNSEFAAQASDHDPQVVRIRPPAAPTTTGKITALPSRVLRGLPVVLVLTKFEPTESLVISLDGVQVGTVKTDKHGAAVKVVPIPVKTALGEHAITATTASGASASTTITVIAWPAVPRQLL